MGNNAHLRNQSKLINTFEQSYGYIIKLSRRGNSTFLRIKWFFFVKSWVSFTQGCLCQIWLKLAQWFREGRFLNLVNLFLQFCQISPWKRAWPLIWTNFSPKLQTTWVPFNQGWFVPSVFSLFCNNLPLNRAWLFIWTNFSPFHQGWFVLTLVEIGPVGLEKKIFKFHRCIFATS